MNKILFTLIICMVSIKPILASEDGSGTYFGLGGGYSTYNADFFVNQYFIEEDVGVSATRGFRDNATGLKIYGGYQFNKIVAVEAAYTEYGKFTAANYAQDPSSFSVYANLGYNFLNGQLRPFGLIGLGYLKSFQSRDLLEQDFATLHGGVGIEYSPTALNGIGFRASVDWDVRSSYEDAVDDSSNEVVSAFFYQSYTLWSVAVQYKF